MHILVIGATGACGILLIKEALSAGHTVVAFARNPQKIPEEFKNYDNLKIVKGELTDRESLENVLDNVDAVISALGPAVSRGPFHSSDTPIAKIYALLIELMQKKGVKRLIALSTASMPAPEDKFDFKHWLSVGVVSTLAHSAYKDVVAMGKTITAADDLEWTLARVPVLTNSDDRNYTAGFLGDGITGILLSRIAFAFFVIKEVKDRNWVHRIPMVTNF